MEMQINFQPENMQKLENIYQELKIVPLGEVTKKFLEAKLKLAGDIWNEIENAFDDEVLHVYEQIILIVYSLKENLGTQNCIRPSEVQPVMSHQTDRKSSNWSISENASLEAPNHKVSIWPELDSGAKEIKFIEKPMHLRSIKPLHRIVINQPLLIDKEAKLVENFRLETSTATSSIYKLKTSNKIGKESTNDKFKHRSIQYYRINEIVLMKININLASWWSIKRNLLGELLNRWLGYKPMNHYVAVWLSFNNWTSI